MNEISIWQVLNIIVKRLWAILLVSVILAGATYVYNANFVTPTYAAKSAILATNGGIATGNQQDTSSKIGSSDLASSLSIVDTYVDIFKTYSFYEYIEEQPEIQRLNLSARQLLSMTSVSRRSEESLFIDVRVANTDPKTAVIIANCVAMSAPDYVNTKLPGASAEPADKCISAYVTGPLTARNTVLAFLFGAFVSIVFFIILAATDKTIKGEDEITKRYNITVLGVVPDFDTKTTKGARR
ncbi:MAG: hypothetical protein IJ426_03530 [Clostridia bacterium]|nr:hypothetical protein [Clostridia bacterium]